MTFTPYNDAERLANDVLRAAGSGLHNYTMPATRKAIIDAATRPTDPQVTALVEALEALIAAVEFEAPPIIDGIQVVTRGRILLDCAKEARAVLAAFGSKAND